MKTLASELAVGQTWRWEGGLTDRVDMTMTITKIEKGDVHFEDNEFLEQDFMEVFEFVYMWLQGYYVLERHAT